MSIFVEEKEGMKWEKCIKNLTKHYKDELPHLALDEVWVASEYRQMKYLIEQYKYQSEREKLQELASYIIDIYRHYIWQIGEDEEWCIIPVPMHWSRYFIRGFDHMWLIARVVSESTWLPYISPLRTAYRPRQSGLKRTSRLANKSNAFRMWSGFSTVPKNIILIDDVISSGSTANACAEVLKAHGAEKVIGYFIASNN
jgi:competence protein ComFC